jgi:hypothetical protein
LLAQVFHRQTTWQVEAWEGKVELLEKLWEWAKEVLSPQELNNYIVLAKDDSERTAWHVAEKTGSTKL